MRIIGRRRVRHGTPPGRRSGCRARVGHLVDVLDLGGGVVEPQPTDHDTAGPQLGYDEPAHVSLVAFLVVFFTAVGFAVVVRLVFGFGGSGALKDEGVRSAEVTRARGPGALVERGSASGSALLERTAGTSGEASVLGVSFRLMSRPAPRPARRWSWSHI